MWSPGSVAQNIDPLINRSASTAPNGNPAPHCRYRPVPVRNSIKITLFYKKEFRKFLIQSGSQEVGRVESLHEFAAKSVPILH